MAPIVGSKSVASINRSHMLCTKFAQIQQYLNGTFNPSCTKVFLRPHLQGGWGGGIELTPSMILKTVDFTNFSFERPIELYMKGQKMLKLML